MATKLAIQKINPPGPTLFVELNPEEYSLSKDNTFATQAIPGLSSPLVQYVSGNARTLEMELLFDTYDTPDAVKLDVRTKTDPIADLLKIESDTHAPAILLLSWSSLQLTCVLTKLTQKFLLFSNDGTPVRARLNVSFQEYIDPDRQAKIDNKQTADFTKSHTLIEGETIDALAFVYYGDATLWRPIAIANGLTDPSRLASASRLIIPSLPYRDPDTGLTIN